MLSGDSFVHSFGVVLCFKVTKKCTHFSEVNFSQSQEPAVLLNLTRKLAVPQRCARKCLTSGTSAVGVWRALTDSIGQFWGMNTPVRKTWRYQHKTQNWGKMCTLGSWEPCCQASQSGTSQWQSIERNLLFPMTMTVWLSSSVSQGH